jgi:hypothetical protein
MSLVLAILLLLGCATVNGGATEDDVYPLSGVRKVRDTSTARQARVDYPDVFAVVDDPSRTEEIDPRPLRDDLTRAPVEAKNYRALWAAAVAFFELHARAERNRGRPGYFAYSFQATKMVAIPWRPYGEISDPALRSAILAFYEDVLFGDKPGLAAVRGRYTKIVAALGEKETDPELQERIRGMLVRAEELSPQRDP